MSVIQNSAEDFVALFNKKAGTTLTLADLTLSAPAVLSGGADGNSRIKLTVADANATYAGKGYYKYGRLDLALLPPLIYKGPSIEVGANSTTHSVLAAIKQQLNISIEAYEVVALPIDTVNRRVTLRATPASPRWFGECVLPLRDLPSITRAIYGDTVLWS